MYRIGMFSKLGKVTIKTLRHYDEVGLLTPAYVEEENGYRYYTTSQLFRLNEIVALRQMGFSIAEITDIVDGRNVSMILQQRRAELYAEQQGITQQLFRLNHYIQEEREGRAMNYQAVLKEIPAFTVFAAQCTVPNYAALNEIIPALGAKVTQANPGLKRVEPGYCFNVYQDGRGTNRPPCRQVHRLQKKQIVRDCLDTKDPQFLAYKLWVLAVGFIIYVAFSLVAYQRSMRSFENLDL